MRRGGGAHAYVRASKLKVTVDRRYMANRLVPGTELKVLEFRVPDTPTWDYLWAIQRGTRETATQAERIPTVFVMAVSENPSDARDVVKMLRNAIPLQRRRFF